MYELHLLAPGTLGAGIPSTKHLPPARAQLQHVPDIASMGINPDHFRGAGEKPSEERAQKHEHYAAIYNQVRLQPAQQ